MHVSRMTPRDKIGQNVTMEGYNFDRVAYVKFLGAIITSDNDISEEIKLQKNIPVIQ